MLGFICDRCDARVLMTNAACERGCKGVCCLQAGRERRRCDPLRVLALSGLPSSSVTVRDPAMRMAPRRLVVAFAAPRWRRCVGASIHFEGLGGREASSAPPSPSRHDQWRFLRCVWICVIALAIAAAPRTTTTDPATIRSCALRAPRAFARPATKLWLGRRSAASAAFRWIHRFGGAAR